VLLCIGVIFTGFWSFLITAHGFAQAYRLGTVPPPPQTATAAATVL
jgi:hypothetical protein